MYTHAKIGTFDTRTVDLRLNETAFGLQAHTPGELIPLFDSMEDLLGILGYPRKDIFAVTLTLHEAITNAFRHGNRGDQTRIIDIRYLVTSDEVLFEVSDQGPGFDPNQVPDPRDPEVLDRPGGRGLFLMRTYASWVSFNREGNRVTFCRQRSQR